MNYTFISENGIETIAYADYLRRRILTKQINDRSAARVLLDLGDTIITYDTEWLASHDKERKAFQILQDEKFRNPLRFYCPCAASAPSPGQSTMAQFINDRDHTVTANRMGNRGGKTTSAWIKMLTTLGAIPCDPSWECFTRHGIEYVPWTGPKVIIVCTYMLANHVNTIWPQIIQAWTPAHELGRYAKGGNAHPSWKGNPRLKLACGTEIYLLTYEQDQGVFESQAVDLALWDEQGLENLFIAVNERVATRRGKHVFSLTPHKIEGRPDTGAGSWIHKLFEGQSKYGISVRDYEGNLIEDSPDWIYPEATKKEKIEQWIVQPRIRGDMKAMREGLSRLYGKWHASSGLVYDNYDAEVHDIEPFDIPRGWTRYRGVDYGRTNPSACVYVAIGPLSDVSKNADQDELCCVAYKVYYDVKSTIDEHCRLIVEASGNKREPDGYEERIGPHFKRYRELAFTPFRDTALDGRSFSNPDAMMGLNIGDLFRIHGLQCSRATLRLLPGSIAQVNQWFAVDYTKPHPWKPGVMGRSRLYIFRTALPLVDHIKQYVNADNKKNDKNVSELPKMKEDHDLDGLRYAMCIPPLYIEGWTEENTHRANMEDDEPQEKERRHYDRITGY